MVLGLSGGRETIAEDGDVRTGRHLPCPERKLAGVHYAVGEDRGLSDAGGTEGGGEAACNGEIIVRTRCSAQDRLGAGKAVNIRLGVGIYEGSTAVKNRPVYRVHSGWARHIDR